jgi:hypothetical protein
MPSDTPTSVRVLRNIDVPVLALALVIFLVAGLPILGWLTGAGAWAIQRLISEYATRKSEQAEDPRAKVGILAGSMIGRGWLVAGTILAVGLIGAREDGLAAALLCISLFTIYFAAQMVVRPFDMPRPPR